MIDWSAASNVKAHEYKLTGIFICRSVAKKHQKSHGA
jgi:hypothetical protein